MTGFVVGSNLPISSSGKSGCGGGDTCTYSIVVSSKSSANNTKDFDGRAASSSESKVSDFFGS